MSIIPPWSDSKKGSNSKKGAVAKKGAIAKKGVIAKNGAIKKNIQKQSYLFYSRISANHDKVDGLSDNTMVRSL